MTEASGAANRPPRRRWLWPIVAMLLGAHVVLATTAVARHSNAFDEAVHLVAGYSYWLRNDYRLHPENGLLPQRLAAVPLMAMDLDFPPRDDPDWAEARAWMLSAKFLYTGDNDPEPTLAAARAMITLVSAGLGLFVFVWSRRLFGDGGGLVSLTLYALSPTMLAHGALVTSDLIAAAMFLVASGATWRLLHRVTPGTMLAAAAALGGLALAKASAVLFLPMAAVLVGVRLAVGRPLEVSLPWRGGGRRWRFGGRMPQAAVLAGVTALQLALVAGIVWAGYGLRFEAAADPPRPDGFDRPWSHAMQGVGPGVAAGIEFLRHHELLPEAFLYGTAYVITNAQSRESFLAGRHSFTGFAWFFPYAFALKTPLAMFGLLALAAWAALRRGMPWAGVYRTVPLWVLIGVYTATSLASTLNIGHRHLLPLYPAMFVLAGAAGGWLGDPRRVVRWAVPALMMVFVGVSLWAWPHYLSYFNVLCGGPSQTYRHLVDSSLDWGQELPALRDYLAREGLLEQHDTPVYLSYFGSSFPHHYGIEPIYLPSYMRRRRVEGPPEPLRPGVYAISATLLQGIYAPIQGAYTPRTEQVYQAARGLMQRWWPAAASRDSEALIAIGAEFGATPAERDRNLLTAFENYENTRFARLTAYLRQREPDAQAGYAILIYHLDEAELREALDGPAPLPRR